MVFFTLGALGLAAGGAAYVKSSPAATENLEVALGWKKSKRRVCGEDGMPSVAKDAPSVRCFGPQRSGEVRLFGLFTDQVMLNTTPGPPQETLNVHGAEVTQQGAVVMLQWADQALTLQFEDAEEAEYWAEAVGFAAGSEAPGKVAELEERVAAALRAAYDRSARIMELENTLDLDKEREERIQQLEEVLHDTLEEAEARAERIEALEKLQTTGSAHDVEAQVLLQDAMDFADELLEQHELWTEDDGQGQLREAVQAVQRAKPKVDTDVAELIGQLVTALGWPVVLRQRLADAEQTMKEQEEIQEQALREIKDLQKQNDTLSSEAAEHKAQLKAAREQKSLTDALHEEEMRKLKEKEEEAERRRHQAEDRAKELQELLVYADEAAEEAIERKREELEKTHQEEILRLKHLTEAADAQQKEAHFKAVDLHEKLAKAEASIDAKAQAETEKLSAQHQDEITSLKKQIFLVEEQRDQAKEQTLLLNKQLVDSQASQNDVEHLKEALEEARKIHAVDLEEREKMDAKYVEELEELKRNREATDLRRQEAAGHLAELRTELRGMASRWESAQVAEELAEAKAQKLKEQLVSEMAERDAVKLPKLEKENLEDMLQQQRDAESSRKAADARAEELRRKLEEAERRAAEAAQQQKASLDAQREEEVTRLKSQMQSAEEKVDKMESQASQFREKLEKAEVSLSEEAQRRRDLLDERLRSMSGDWKGEAQRAGVEKELDQRLENAEKALKSMEETSSKNPRGKKGQRG